MAAQPPTHMPRGKWGWLDGWEMGFQCPICSSPTLQLRDTSLLSSSSSELSQDAPERAPFPTPPRQNLDRRAALLAHEDDPCLPMMSPRRRLDLGGRRPSLDGVATSPRALEQPHQVASEVDQDFPFPGKTCYSNPLFTSKDLNSPLADPGGSLAEAAPFPPTSGHINRLSPTSARAATRLFSINNQLLFLIPLLLLAASLVTWSSPLEVRGWMSVTGKGPMADWGIGQAATVASRALSALGIMRSGSGSTPHETVTPRSGKGWDPDMAVRVAIVVPRCVAAYITCYVWSVCRRARRFSSYLDTPQLPTVRSDCTTAEAR